VSEPDRATLVRIQPLCWKQWGALVRLWRMVFPGDPPDLPAWYLRHHASDIHVLQVGGRLCGFLLGYLHHEEPGCAWVEYGGVDRKVRGHGLLTLGDRLLRDFESRAAAAGCARVVLGVRMANRRAMRLYERRGYHPVGTGPGVVHYAKRLEPAGPAPGSLPPKPPLRAVLRLMTLAWRWLLYAVLVRLPGALPRRPGARIPAGP